MLGECFCILLPEKSLIDEMDVQLIALMTLYFGSRWQTCRYWWNIRYVCIYLWYPYFHRYKHFCT